VSRGLNALERAIDWALIGGGGLVCAVVMINVIARYLLNVSLAWVNEFGETVFVWLTFLGSAKAVRRFGHLAVLEFVDALPPRLSRLLFVALWGLTAAVLATMAWYGAQISLSNMSQRMSVTGWPVGVLYWAMPVGAVLMLVFVVEQILSGKAFRDEAAEAPESRA
jgi:TRAP-type C4-dicarboxylate transport system permease small subunit